MSKKLISILVCLIVLAGCIGILQWKASFADEEIARAAERSADGTAMTTATETQSTPSETEEAATAAPVTETPENTDDAPVAAPAAPGATTDAGIEANGALSIGDADAPVTMLEFSSLSCPHCARFHNEVLGPLKKDYVDTGKVRIVFMDFPLNRQALDASLLTRCVDTSSRYDFMNMLFEQQDQWAFEENHRDKLVQYAALVGLSRDAAEACMNDIAGERELLTTMRMASERYAINSTPTFIILPGEQMIAGSQSYGLFSSTFDPLLAE